MHYISIDDYDQWRQKARDFLQAEIRPDQITWNNTLHQQRELFAPDITDKNLLISSQQYCVPADFFSLAKAVSCHRLPTKWSFLYEALWRLTHGEKNLLKILSDPLMHKLFLLEKAVRRDSHKMKAFVRFRCYKAKDEIQKDDYYIAWFEPDHLIVRRVAPFFQRRFSAMNWAIITPDEIAVWSHEILRFLPGQKNFKHPREDELEDLWRTYYRAIFNPARIKTKAMRNEMPVRYWHNLPETKIIHEILQEAPVRVAQMLKYSEGLAQTAKDYFPDTIHYSTLKKSASSCKACPLYQKGAKQTVFGEGNLQADMVIVAEQPGMKEDTQGSPLIGPSGQFLRNILKTLGMNPDTVYYTNAVKHFKHQVINNKILYQSPTIKEIYACKPWLEAEVNLIKPKVILSLGLIAAKSLISGGFHLKEQRKQLHSYQDIPVVATYHPSAILRTEDNAAKRELTHLFTEDVRKAVEIAANPKFYG